MVTAMTGVATTVEADKEAPPRLSGTALIVEDNLIIAMSAEVILLELGARHVGTAASVSQALSSIDREKPDFALLDLNLGNENSIPVATRLAELKVPFMFATGYGERAPIPAELADAPVVQKPYTREVVEAALVRLREAIQAKG
jgi:DNA-binding LytR/AlgR family response regulator